MPRPLVLALCLFPLASAAALAERIGAASTIDAVSVHPDGAMVTRRVSIDLPQGGSTVVITGLPGFVDAEGLRVRAKAGMALTLVGHDLSAGRPRAEKREDPALVAKRVEVEQQKGRIGAMTAKQRAMLRYADAQPTTDGEGNAVDPEFLRKGWEIVGGALAMVNADLATARARLAELETDLAAAEEAAARIRKPGPETVREVSVIVEAGAAGKAEFELSYPVRDARWGARYDAALRTAGEGGKPTLEVVRLAVVSQGSGEDWDGARLTVETTQLNRSRQMAAVGPQRAWLLPEKPDPVIGQARRSLDAAEEMSLLPPGSHQGNAAMQTVEARPLPSPMLKATTQVASAETRGVSHGFFLPTRISVLGDGTPRALRLEEVRVEPTVRVDVAPRFDESGYLSAAFKWTGQAPLFPGRVTLTSDGVSVGKADLPFVPAGEEHVLGFGVDDLVKVERLPEKVEETENGVLVNVTRTRRSDARAKLTNRHAGPVEVRVTDRIPFSDQPEVKIERKAVTPEPDSLGTESKQGVLTWNRKLAPGESLSLRVAYDVTWPKGRSLTYTGR